MPDAVIETTDLLEPHKLIDTSSQEELDELDSLYKLRRSIKNSKVIEPIGVRASVLSPDDVLRESFPDWGKPFTAGVLLTSPNVWSEVFF